MLFFDENSLSYLATKAKILFKSQAEVVSDSYGATGFSFIFLKDRPSNKYLYGRFYRCEFWADELIRNETKHGIFKSQTK
jgi:hypothetical protein